MKRDEFKALLAERQQLLGQRFKLYEECDATLVARLREYKPRWKGDDADIRYKAGKLEDWEVAELRRPVVDRHNRGYEAISAELRWLDTQLARLAAVTTPRVGTSPVWCSYDRVWGSTYRSQGFGANHYAKGRAELKAMEIEAAEGIQARVTEVKLPRPNNPGPYYVHTSDWLIEVNVADPVDAEIIRRRPGCSMRDFIKGCWRKGLNPRVYDPFLPWGIEAKLGLDHFGNDVEARTDQA